ncbi:unnamed protein product [Paramecium primaurelia]|uniref:Transmembrane protein n=1 Tax=Paramecium primaurelia TaxID=5886 RepID=A0A8S1Q0P4_PARPR|nr:unnamed protein product [Paramecium primaurelia]
MNSKSLIKINLNYHHIQKEVLQKFMNFDNTKKIGFFQFLVIYLGCTKAEQLSIIILQRIIKCKKYLNMSIKYLLFFNNKTKMDLAIQLESVKEMIKQLEQREADICRIKTLKQQLIRRIDMGDDKWKIINLFEQQFYIMNIIFRNQIIFVNFIFIILNIAFLQKKLKNLWNWHQQLQNQWILIIIGIVTKVNNQDKSKERISKILQLIIKINSNESRSILLQKLHSIFTLFLRNNSAVNLEQIEKKLSNYAEQEQDKFNYYLHLLIKKDNKLIKSINLRFLCLDTQDFDPQLFKLFLKYVYIQKELMKSDSEQQLYLSDLGKFNQNCIIYEDRLVLKKQEVLHIQNSQWQYLQGAEQLNQEQLFKQMAIQQQKYFEYNCYEDIDIIQILNNVIKLQMMHQYKFYYICY